MLEVNGIYEGLPILLAIFCIIIANRYYISFFENFWAEGKHHAALPVGEPTSQIPGNHLYYGRTKWPQYEARFNLRLSYLYGPVIPIKLGPDTLFAKAVRWANLGLCRDRKHSDTTILINSLTENETILKKLLGSCASRSPSIAAGKYLSRGRRIVLQPYGPDWTRHRRAFASLLTKEKINTRWAKALRFEAMVMVDRIADLGAEAGCSENLLDEISRFTASSVLQITYARRAATPQDLVLRDLETVSQNIASAFTPGKYWVEDFPFLDNFPSLISPWKRKLNSDHHFELNLFRDLLHAAESNLTGDRYGSGETIDPPSVAGGWDITTGECAAAELLRNREHLQLDRDDVAYLAAGIFEAGTETTAMTIHTFLLAAASTKTIVTRGQAEIDQLMNSKDRPNASVPNFEELQHLPYLAAIVKETLRLTPAGTSGVGHTTTQAEPQTLDLGYESGRETMRLTVPTGATVLANIYGIHHNDAQFPEPWRFNPDRWLYPVCPSNTQNNKVHSVTLDHTHASYAFGFGKRICPGSSLASYSLSISIAMLLLCFDFELTDKARLHYMEMERQQQEEHRKWDALFPNSGIDTMLRGGSVHKDCGDELDHIGSVLIDSHIAFKLSRRQLADCVKLQPRKQDHGLRAVRDALAVMQYI
ncbi:hypothetical protein VPNG_07763 [Cytospora leucostoma]|uniref:Cytochrome P450 n=1 Tax=Cytospora leucostoma TaxID=1230097 RepID=A0A423W8B5_9PEZI|nr:hypothetical protein VPNG_07763 [Cytospora leucostoma]